MTDRNEKLEKMQACDHLVTKKVCAGLLTDSLYRCRQIVADQCLSCGALLSPDIPTIPGAAWRSPEGKLYSPKAALNILKSRAGQINKEKL